MFDGDDVSVDKSSPMASQKTSTDQIKSASDNNIDANTVIPEGGMLLYPVAVRAPAGHCKREPTEVVLTDALMSRPLSVNTMLQLPDCFHVTQRCTLGKIRMEGLVPGGNGIQSRMLTCFNPYAPWDYRSWKITKSVDTRSGGYIVLYSQRKLCSRHSTQG